MPNISEVILMDVSRVLPYRTKKFCVCISAGDDKYFFINSESREMYDDFKIKSSDYNFLKKDSYVSCHKTHILGKELIVRKLGDFNYNDMVKILNKIRNSNDIPEGEKESLIFNLENWLG